MERRPLCELRPPPSLKLSDPSRGQPRREQPGFAGGASSLKRGPPLVTMKSWGLARSTRRFRQMRLRELRPRPATRLAFPVRDIVALGSGASMTAKPALCLVRGCFSPGFPRPATSTICYCTNLLLFEMCTFRDGKGNDRFDQRELRAADRGERRPTDRDEVRRIAQQPTEVEMERSLVTGFEPLVAKSTQLGRL